MLVRFFTALLTASCAFGALSPREVMVACNTGSVESVSIAFYYARQRGIPENNIAQIRLPRGMETRISRADYENLIEKPLLGKVNAATGIRCLVLTMGMPYIIEDSPALTGFDNELSALRQLEAETTGRIAAALENVCGEAVDAGDEKAVSKALKAALDEALASDKNRQLAFLDKALPLYGTRLSAQMAEMEFALEGFCFPEEKVADALVLRQSGEERWGISEKLAARFYDSYAALYGLLEALEQVRTDTGDITGRATGASIDSELAVMRFAPHTLSGPLPNEYYHGKTAANSRTLLVSRLDGPGERLVKKMIRRSAEEPGCLDCVTDLRAAAEDGLDDYAPFDERLSRAAHSLELAGFNSLVENTSALYEGRRECAFYAGWYSPGVFKSRLSFAPRSVAVHIASLEAKDIRSRKSGLWCAGLLEAGACCTFGAAAEPYLSHFPEPDALVSRLLAGDCIAEAYFFAKPSNSWQMILIADPLMIFAR